MTKIGLGSHDHEIWTIHTREGVRDSTQWVQPWTIEIMLSPWEGGFGAICIGKLDQDLAHMSLS